MQTAFRSFISKNEKKKKKKKKKINGLTERGQNLKQKNKKKKCSWRSIIQHLQIARVPHTEMPEFFFHLQKEDKKQIN
jgi:hypothetical protein